MCVSVCDPSVFAIHAAACVIASSCLVVSRVLIVWTERGQVKGGKEKFNPSLLSTPAQLLVAVSRTESPANKMLHVCRMFGVCCGPS